MAKIREKQILKRKQETLEAALRLLAQHGYASLNMDDLAEEVGISKPTLYQYFNSKEDLIAQAILSLYEKIEGRLDALAERPARDQIVQFLRVLLEWRVDKRNPLTHMDGEMIKDIVQSHPPILEHTRAIRRRLGEIVKVAQDQGQIDPTLPPWVVANAMLSLQGAILNPWMGVEPRRPDDEIAEAIESVLRMFQRSIAVETPESAPVLAPSWRTNLP
jgi:AcrR family transcriptional regulator